MRLQRLLAAGFLSLVGLCLLWGCASTSKADISHDKKASSDVVEAASNHVVFQVGRAPENMIAADFDKDGLVDIATVAHGESVLKIFQGTGPRRFKLVKILGDNIVGHHPRRIEAVDWDKDGLKDIVCSAEGDVSVMWFRNTGHFDFKRADVFNLSIPPDAMAVTDMDGDGRLDIVLGPYDSGPVTVLWGKAQGKFDFDISNIPAGRIVLHLVTGDWNSDGKPDIFWSETHSYKTKVALNQGNRKFKVKTIFQRPRDILELPRSVATADINGDGCLDAVSPLEIGKAAVIIYGDCKGGVLKTDRIEAPVYGFRGVGAVSAGKGHPAMIALGETNRFFIGTRSDAGTWALREFPARGIPEEFEFTDIDKDGFLDLLYINRVGDDGNILFGPLLR